MNSSLVEYLSWNSEIILLFQWNTIDNSLKFWMLEMIVTFTFYFNHQVLKIIRDCFFLFLVCLNDVRSNSCIRQFCFFFIYMREKRVKIIHNHFTCLLEKSNKWIEYAIIIHELIIYWWWTSKNKKHFHSKYGHSILW